MNASPRSAFGAPPPGSAAGGSAQPAAPAPDALRGPELNRLRWRCRRGLLENDLFIERFFRRHQETLTRGQAAGLERLMELPDNDLLDLLLARREPQGELDRDDVRHVLALLRTQGSQP